ncbi:Hypothetical protein GGA_1066 [Haemophilus haemolyticus M21127]|uniref:Uncharacterized protein n=1 Tax=Haemophilus haemolyticus M19501 TaxID=1028803 RepID=F9GMA9_HAEHA|nr:Hypothetical protein GGA_1066 [Haemophilus haemolyticus M21127]EGT77338.1 Hypothetical protein GG9_0305 [Haemophilus haemolyticus M19501]EGT79045.1 Hypothetical protein GGE_2091 [Haemophilus haemolyticus M21639]
MFYPCEKIMADFSKVRKILETFYHFYY